MYTLGQIARAIWPGVAEVPNDVLSALLTKPCTGLGLAARKEAFKQADQGELARLYSQLPTDLSDPPRGVPEEHQMPFWIGYYHYFSAIQSAKEFGPNELTVAGQALYGDRWQTDLARDLGLSDGRRIRQWLSGDRPIPIGVWDDVARFLRDRQMTIQSVLHSITDK